MSHISVILCSHNGELYIEDQIKSILRQEMPVDLIHVHDFASRDSTLDIVERLASHSAISISITSHTVAPGPAASFIKALRATLPTLPRDALILFSDQDDIWLPNKLAVVRQEISEKGLSADSRFLLFHDVRVVDSKLSLLRSTYYTGNPFRLPRDLNPVRLMMSSPAIGHTMLLSAPLAKAVAGWPDTDCYLMHDWLAMLVASRTGHIHYIPMALSLYRQHDSNVLGAYRQGRRVAPLARLMRFMDQLIHQAVCFSSTRASAPRPRGSALAFRLELVCCQGYRPAAFALAVAALTHGPTCQRKAIGLLLLARALIGPIRKQRVEEV